MPWLPAPLFLAATPIIHILQPQFRHESQAVVSMLYTLFCASPSLMVAILAGQTYLENGSLRMLILGLGAVFFGAIYLMAALLLPDYNAGVTVHNFGFLLSGICFLLSRPISGRLAGRFGDRRWLILSLAYTAAAGAMTLWIWAAYKGLLPTFYVSGVGYTPLRHLILGMGVATYAASSLWYWRLYLRSRSRFDRWFCQSVALIGVAMVAAIVVPAGGTAMAWMVRVAQCIGGIYMLMAILSAVQDTGAWRIPLEQALRRHESQYRAVVENVSEGLFVIDHGGSIVLANQAMIKLAGWDRAPGGSLVDYSKRIQVWNTQDYDVPLEQWPASRALRGEVVRDEELCIHRHDTGRDYTALYSAQPIRDERDRIERVVVTVRDISERKQAEEALRESEERLSIAKDAAELGIHDYDVSSGAIRWDQRIRDLWGVGPDEPITYDLFISGVHPEDRERTQSAVDRALDPTGEGKYAAEYRVISRCDGATRWVTATGQVFFENHRAVRLVGTAQDITERKLAETALRESEERIRLSVEAANLGTWDLDLTTDTAVRSLRHDQIWGYTESLTEWGLEIAMQHVVPEDHHRIMDAYDRGIKSGVLSHENRIVQPNGNIRWIRAYGHFKYNNSGRPVRVMGVVEDITEKKQTEEALRQLNETLEQQVAERTELAEARARQLQRLAVELIEAEERERRRIAVLLREDLQQILAASRFQLQTVCRSLPNQPMLSNIDRLLEESIGKSRSLSHELSPPALHHSGLISAIKGLIRQMSEQFGLKVHLETDSAHRFDDSPLKVFIYRALQELLFNVVKHAGVKSARVILAGPDGSLVVTVTDQGRGFDPDILDSTVGKAGFGLLTLRERARYIGGDLFIESAPGKGSRFILTVPLRIVKRDEQRSAPAADPQLLTKAERAGYETRGIRVLFADDHKVMRQGLMNMIADQPDIEVVGEAADGREAVERARQLKPDVIVMDIAMPEMDGVEATRRIKAEFPEVRVIGLSMYEDELLARTMRDAGAEAFLSKTTSSSELLKAIYGIIPIRIQEDD